MMNQDHPIEEHLLLQYLLGELTDAQRDQVEEWLRESEANRAILDGLESLWLETGKLNPPPLAVEIDAAWEKISARMKDGDTKVIPLFRRKIFRIAAAILILIGISSFLFLMLQKEKIIKINSGYAVIQDTLPDGSVIMLNKYSSISYPEKFNGKKREIKLTGEALFSVYKNAERPFIVDAGLGSVMVTGTIFNVSAIPGKDLIVTVKEGKVILFRVDPLTNDTASLLLLAGSSGAIRQGSDHPEKIETIAPDQLFWTDHTLDFHATPLSFVFQVIEKNYKIRISTKDPAILNCLLSATFNENDPENIIRVICESFGLTYNRNGDTYQIIGNGCTK